MRRTALRCENITHLKLNELSEYDRELFDVVTTFHNIESLRLKLITFNGEFLPFYLSKLAFAPFGNYIGRELVVHFCAVAGM